MDDSYRITENWFICNHFTFDCVINEKKILMTKNFGEDMSSLEFLG